MGLLSLLGFGKKRKKVDELLEEGGIIVDVRSQAEFNQAHVEGAINVPLESIQQEIPNLKKLNKPLILCCAIGVRSGSIVQMLRKEGIECINGGAWRSLQ
jgi:rhodanese-related sulfurtransferase